MALDEYKRKRHFAKTPEPTGQVAVWKRGRDLTFVVQKHAARRLHYDFRLELDGVLKSWAVPKGPSLDPQEKRLAVQTEDHPLDYATFEGSIPQGQYGGGEVIVWDRGTWIATKDAHKGLKSGKLEFELHGERLTGAWTLIRLRDFEEPANWLLIKRTDDVARPVADYEITVALPTSVASGRTIEDIAAGKSVKKPVAKKTAGKKRATVKQAILKRTTPVARSKAKSRTKKKSKVPDSVSLQLATLGGETPSGPQWLHEMKFDGYRILARCQEGKVKLLTRNEQDWSHRYPTIVQALESLPVDSALFDGELVALLPSGLSSFQSLQNATKGSDDTQLAYYLFDLLFLNGEDLRTLPLLERKQRLTDVIAAKPNTRLKLSEHVAGDGPTFFQQACQLGLEGVISKRDDRPYRSGRSEEWIKSKCVAREELVIGGYTVSTAVARGIGALLVGYYHQKKFHYAGRVGTGFSQQTLLDLRARLEKLRQDDCPFLNVPAKERGSGVRWVRPELVAQLEFTGWTDSGVLRHPSFQGLREDKPAASVSRPASLVEPAVKSPARVEPAAELPIQLTHPDRVLYADSGLTKLGLATYYQEVARWMLPHLRDRPLSLLRCPAGQSGKCFFQKHAGRGTPEALQRIVVEEEENAEPYVMANDLAGLLSLVQMSVLEIHPWGSQADRLDQPDRLIFDLDPDESVPWKTMIEAAHTVRAMLQKQGLESFLKTTGGKGLHLVVPLSPRRHDWKVAKAFSRNIAEQLAVNEPSRYVATMSKAARRGKIFIDYLRNDRGSTAVAPYSTRAKPGAPVSLPIAWEELSPNLRSDHFRVDNALARLRSQTSDPWAGFFEIKQTIPKSASRK